MMDAALPHDKIRRLLAGIVILALFLAPIFPRTVHPWSGVSIQALLAAALYLLWHQKGSRILGVLKQHPLGWPLLVYALFSLASLFWTVYVDRTQECAVERLEGIILFIILAGAGFNRFERRAILGAIAMTALVTAGIALFEHLQGYEKMIRSLQAGEGPFFTPEMRTEMIHSLQQGRALALYGNPNHLASHMAMLAPGFLAIIIWSRDIRLRLAGLGGVLLLCYVILITQSRGGILILMVSAAILASVMLIWRKQNLPVSAVISMLLLFTLFTGCAERTFTTVTLGPRMQYARGALSMIPDAPVLGYGANTFAIKYPQYRRPHDFEAQQPHNLILQSADEMGFFGALIAFWIYATAFLGVLRLLKRVRQGAPPDPIHIGAACAVCGFLVHALLDMNNTIFALYSLFCASAAFFPPSDRMKPTEPENRPSKRMSILTGLVLAGIWIYACFIPYLAKTCFEIAQLELVKGNGPRALEMYKTAQSLNPDNAEYLHHLGKTWAFVQPEHGITYMERAIKLNPQQAWLHASLAEVYASRGRLEKALEAITQAAFLHPARAEYHKQRAIILRRLHRNAEAEEEEARADELKDNEETSGPRLNESP